MTTLLLTGQTCSSTHKGDTLTDQQTMQIVGGSAVVLGINQNNRLNLINIIQEEVICVKLQLAGCGLEDGMWIY